MTNTNTYSPAIQAIMDSKVYPKHEATWNDVLPSLGNMSGTPDAVRLWNNIGNAAAAELRAV